MFQNCFDCNIVLKMIYLDLLLLNNTIAFDFDFIKYSAAKWHNMNNRGCKPTDNYKLNVTALKGLNI
jgi:hypothetical protein